MRHLAKRSELYRNPVCKRSLSRGGRPRYHDKFHMAVTPHLPGDLPDAPLLLRLLQQYHLLHPVAADHIVQLAHVLDPRMGAPVRRFLQSPEQLLLGTKRLQCKGLFLIRHHQHKALVIGNYLKMLHISRAGQHIPVIIVIKTVQTVQIHAGTSPVTEQLFLILHAVLTDQLHALCHRIIFLCDQQILLCHLQHPLPDLTCQLLRDLNISLHRAIIAVAHRKLYLHSLQLIPAHNLRDRL